jgi:hypothetical protein
MGLARSKGGGSLRERGIRGTATLHVFSRTRLTLNIYLGNEICSCSVDYCWSQDIYALRNQYTPDLSFLVAWDKYVLKLICC